MFDIGWSELLIIAVVTIIVVGPKDLPRLLRSLGQIMRKVRATANEFRGHVDDVIRDAELDDLKSTMDDVKSMNPVNQVKKAISDEVDGVRDIVSETDIRNYHEDFPDDEPFDDFDDPGAEWDDEDEVIVEESKPRPKIAKASTAAQGSKTAPVDENIGSVDGDGPQVNWSDDDKIVDVSSAKAGKKPRSSKGGDAGGKKTAKRTAKKSSSKAARG